MELDEVGLDQDTSLGYRKDLNVENSIMDAIRKPVNLSNSTPKPQNNHPLIPRKNPK